jgi:hypothetical protein
VRKPKCKWEIGVWMGTVGLLQVRGKKIEETMTRKRGEAQ